MTNNHPSYVYELVRDPDPDNGLLVPGHRLRMNYAEIEYSLKLRVFTPGSVVRHLRKNRNYRVEIVGGDQTLQEVAS